MTSPNFHTVVVFWTDLTSVVFNYALNKLCKTKAERNSNFGISSGGHKRDLLGHSQTSEDWRGNGWYRFMEPAGTEIPENVVATQHCNTFRAGWLNGDHPEIPGQEVNREVCFNEGSESSSEEKRCSLRKDIKILHCGSFYVYYLQKVSTGYLARYCAE